MLTLSTNPAYDVDVVNIPMNALWKTNKPLMAAAILLLPVFGVSLLGIFLDPRIITGMPAWLKPAKFAISGAIYAATMAWVFRYLADWPRLRSVTGWIISIVLVLEVVIIEIQAARGTTSHFNLETPLNTALFTIMGLAILILWFASIAITAALFRQRFSDPVMAWALRIGMVITVLGAATGGLMSAPTGSQVAEARSTGHMPRAGAHTVGAPDGGPGLPGIGWSTEDGDLRVPHFFGLHAIQILPMLAWLWKPRRASAMIAAGCAYAVFFALVLAQALAGMPFARHLP